MSYIIFFSSNFKRKGQHMIRCVVCRCSRLDSEGYKCALCGGAPGLRTEPCHVTVHRPQRPQEADKDLLTTQQWKVRLPGNIIRAVAQNLDDDVRTTKDRTAIRKDLSAFLDIESVRIARLRSCPGLDQHFKSRLEEIRDHHGNERNASLARITLLRHSNDHRVILLLGSVKSYKAPPCLHSHIKTGGFCKSLGAPRPSSKSLTFLLGCTFRKHSFQRKVAGRRWVPILTINLCLGEWWCSSSLHRRRTKQTHGRPSHAYQAEDEWKRPRRSCGSKCANPKTVCPVGA